MATLNLSPINDEEISGNVTGSVGTRYTLINDFPDALGSTTLNFGNGVISATFGLGAASIPTGATIASVKVSYYSYKNGISTTIIKARIKVGGVYYDSPSFDPGNGEATIAQQTETWTLNPATGLAWTRDEIVGVGANTLTAAGWSSTNAFPIITVSSLQVQIDYTSSLSINKQSNAGTITQTRKQLFLNRKVVTETGLQVGLSLHAPLTKILIVLEALGVVSRNQLLFLMATVLLLGSKARLAGSAKKAVSLTIKNNRASIRIGRPSISEGNH